MADLPRGIEADRDAPTESASLQADGGGTKTAPLLPAIATASEDEQAQTVVRGALRAAEELDAGSAHVQAQDVAVEPKTPSSSSNPAETASGFYNEDAALVAARTTSIPPVQVCVRLRPLLAWEKAEGHDNTAMELHDGLEGSVTLKAKEGEEASKAKSFRFDAVFGPDQTQQDMWEMARIDALVGRVAAGFHATIFAYGQTGSGKTHTMEGYAYNHHNGSAPPSSAAGRSRVKLKGTVPDQLGIVPRCVQRLFSHAEALIAQHKADGSPEETFTIKASFLQIYKEKVFDLLNPSHTPAQREAGKGDEFSGLRMRWDATKRQFFVENLFEFECASAEEVLQHYTTGVQNKHVASTAMNVASSRSHTVLVLTLVRTIGAMPTPDNPHAPTGGLKEVVSKLALVDLAGSERSAATANGPTERGGTRFQEAVNINQSLFVLRKVITALSKQGKPPPSARGSSKHQAHSGECHHVPYRESKLTSLLQHAIGGNSFLLMVACLSPSDRHYEENLSTLQYASQAACIKNDPIVNIDPKDRLIDHLRASLQAAHRYILRVTGLEQLPDELMSTARAPSHSRTSQPLQRRTFSCDRRASGMNSTMGSAMSSTAGPGSQTWSSTFSPRQPQAEHKSPFGHAASLSLDAIANGAEESRPSREEPFGRRGASAEEVMARHRASAEEANPPSMCPSSDLLLAAGSAYRPGAVQSSPQESTAGRMSPRRPTGVQKARPPSIPTNSWCSQSIKDVLPPIATPDNKPTGIRTPPAPSPGEGLLAYAEPQNSSSSGWSHSSQKKQKRRGNSHPARSQVIARCESNMTDSSLVEQSPMATSAGSTSSPELHATSEAAAAAVDSGLWEALEELRIEKMGLQEKLKGAEEREDALKVEVKELQAGKAAPLGTTANAHAASDEITEASEGRLEALIRSENEALRRSVALLEDRLEASRSWGPPAAVEQNHVKVVEEVQSKAAMAMDELRETMKSENEALRRERRNLQERLDIFEKALEMESPKFKNVDMDTDLESGQIKPMGLGAKLEKLHAQFVLEVVGLRREVAGLKKKKWVLRSVLASGGEAERLAIENEVMELRKSGGGSFKKAKDNSDDTDEIPETLSATR